MRLPEKDTHFQGAEHYQTDILRKSLKYVRDFRQAVDIGAHVGYWSKHLAKSFKEVVAFEPVQENFDCLLENAPKIKAYNCAIGKEHGLGAMINPKESNSGAWELRKGSEINIFPLDDFNLSPNYIKIDVQGSERNVLLGAERTISIHKPVVVIEVMMEDVFDITLIRLLQKYGLEYREMAMKNIIMG